MRGKRKLCDYCPLWRWYEDEFSCILSKGLYFCTADESPFQRSRKSPNSKFTCAGAGQDRMNHTCMEICSDSANFIYKVRSFVYRKTTECINLFKSGPTGYHSIYIHFIKLIPIISCWCCWIGKIICKTCDHLLKYVSLRAKKINELYTGLIITFVKVSRPASRPNGIQFAKTFHLI